MSKIRNAIIESVSLDDADRGFLTAWVNLDYGGSGQGFGGHTLYLPKGFAHSTNQRNYAGHFIWRVMEIAGVNRWDRVQGKTVRARINDDGKAEAIGHIIKDDWFCPKDDFASMRAEATT